MKRLLIRLFLAVFGKRTENWISEGNPTLFVRRTFRSYESFTFTDEGGQSSWVTKDGKVLKKSMKILRK